MGRADKRRNLHEEVRRLKDANGDLRATLLGEAQTGKAREQAFSRALAIIGALQKERELLRGVEVIVHERFWGLLGTPPAIQGALDTLWDFRKDMKDTYGVQL